MSDKTPQYSDEFKKDLRTLLSDEQAKVDIANHLIAKNDVHEYKALEYSETAISTLKRIAGVE